MNIIPVSSEIVGENRVEGTIAIVARQQQNSDVNFLLLGIIFLKIFYF